MQDRITAYWVLVGRPEGEISLEDLCLDGRIILERIAKKWDWVHGLY
jgi:hypothetical protein